MSESPDKAAPAPVTQASGPPEAGSSTPDPENRESAGSAGRLSRRSWTLLFSGVLVLVFALLGAFVRVPYVALGPGPTYDTLGTVDGEQVVSVDGHRTYRTDGELRMTTVSLNDNMTLFGALGLWMSGRFALAPRENYFRPGQSEDEVRRRNLQQFRDSQSNAEVAALRRLGHPVQVKVKEVEGGSPAAGVLRPGDRLLMIEGRPVEDSDEVRQVLAGTRPGQTVSLTFEREGQPRRTESVTLTSRPDDGTQGFVGFVPIDRADVPFEIDIALEDVGGPSAGLIFALAIVDRMTPGALAGGRHIAGTGEIDAEGNVSPIGGISFKLMAAREAGATAFLVPIKNCDEAVNSAPDGLRLLAVADLGDAIRALEALVAGRPAPSC